MIVIEYQNIIDRFNENTEMDLLSTYRILSRRWECLILILIMSKMKR